MSYADIDLRIYADIDLGLHASGNCFLPDGSKPLLKQM